MTTSCPVTRSAGKRVPAITVRSVVRGDHVPQVEGRDWFFCDRPDCDAVYFASDGETISKSALKVRVGLKEKESPRPVCYCFGHTVESIEEEIARTGRSTVGASVTERVKAGECSCEILNPKGTCCLGDVNRAVKQAFSVLDRARTPHNLFHRGCGRCGGAADEGVPLARRRTLPGSGDHAFPRGCESGPYPSRRRASSTARRNASEVRRRP